MKDRTKVDISTALTTLLAKKAIADITVREIVELCDIRRQTFCTAIRESRICRLRSRAYSRVFVGLFLDWVSNGKKAKNLDCFLDARILVEGGIEGVLKKT